MKKILVFIFIFQLLIIACTQEEENGNNPPFEPNVTLFPNKLVFDKGEEILFSAVSSDPDGDTLLYSWTTTPNLANMTNLGQDTVSGVYKMNWSSYTVGSYVVKCLVRDGKGGEAFTEKDITVENRDPRILKFTASKDIITVNTSITFSVDAVDPDSESISFEWYYNNELQATTTDTYYVMNTFTSEQIDNVKVVAKDTDGGVDYESMDITVYKPLGCLWVIDKAAGSATVKKVSNKGYLIKTLTGLLNPVDIKLDQDRNIIWIADERGDESKVFSFDSELGTDIEELEIDLFQPVSIDLDISGYVWIADRGNKTITRFNNSGSGSVDITIPDIDELQKVLYERHQGDDFLYVIADFALYMYEISSNDEVSIVDTIEVSTVTDIAVDNSHRLWILDSEESQLYTYRDTVLTPQPSQNLEEPEFINYDSANNRLSIINRVGGRIVLINADNPSTQLISPLGQFNLPSDVEVNKNTGEVWVSDTGESRLIRLNSGFTSINLNLNIFTSPTQIEVYSGY